VSGESYPGRWLEQVALRDLVARRHPRNPKTHHVAKIAESILRFGFVAPPELCERTGYIAAGHGRVEALVMLNDGADRDRLLTIIESRDGDVVVPVVRGWSSEDDDELMAYMIADNQNTIIGGWDQGILAQATQRLAGLERGLIGVGFSQEDLDAMMARITPPSPPEAFPPIDPETMETAYRCPSCAYEWSGQPKPGQPTHEPRADAD
jgi:hypothetical protein